MGADSNVISADRGPDGSYWDPDPYTEQPWIGDFIYQCHWSYCETW